MYFTAIDEEIVQLQLMRKVSLLEGTTLLILILVAVPLKHLAGLDIATRIAGTVHGMAFVFYIWMLVRTVTSYKWTHSDLLKLATLALIPFGALINERILAQRQTQLESVSRRSQS